MKIKTLLIVGLLFSVANIFAQIPTGYYDGTAGLSGSALKTKLSSIISSGHQTKSYDALDDEYPNSDKDSYYEKDCNCILEWNWQYRKNGSRNC